MVGQAMGVLRKRELGRRRGVGSASGRPDPPAWGQSAAAQGFLSPLQVYFFYSSGVRWTRRFLSAVEFVFTHPSGWIFLSDDMRLRLFFLRVRAWL
jgi:hypothetical protein